MIPSVLNTENCKKYLQKFSVIIPDQILSLVAFKLLQLTENKTTDK